MTVVSVVFLVIVGMAFAGAAIGAALHWSPDPNAALGPLLLWPSVGVLALAGLISVFSIGLYLLAAAALAAIVALLAKRRPRNGPRPVHGG